MFFCEKISWEKLIQREMRDSKKALRELKEALILKYKYF